MRFISIFVLTSTVFFGLSAGAAHAKFSLCNKTSYTLSAAIGYVDDDRLATRGWWRLRPGQCKIVLNEETNPGRYFVFAEGIAGHRGDLRTWSGETPLCVESSGFFNLRNQEVCVNDPRAQRNFFDVEVPASAGGNWQTDFAEEQNYTVYSAEVAGVQRLLKDIGKSIRRIDGTLGRESRGVLSAYRKEKGLREGATIDDELIDTLIEDANAREAKLGFFYCNKAGAPVWSAIGAPVGEGQYTSKGWWKLEPGECVKVIKGELTNDHYYVYGVIENENGPEQRLSGGDHGLCVNIVKFDIENTRPCDELDYDNAMFKRFEIGGATLATFDFTPEAFTTAPVEEEPQTTE